MRGRAYLPNLDHFDKFPTSLNRKGYAELRIRDSSPRRGSFIDSSQATKILLELDYEKPLVRQK